MSEKNEQGDGREQYRAQVRRRILGMMMDEGVEGFLVAVGEVLTEQARRHSNAGAGHDVIDVGHRDMMAAASGMAHHGKILRGVRLMTANDEQPEGTRYLVALSDKTMANLRKYAKGPGDQSAEQMVTRLVDQLVVLSGMAGTDSASHGAMVKAANELRSRVGIFPDGDRLTTEEIEQASKSIDEMQRQIAKANGYVEDNEPQVADLRVGTTIPDMGELKEWLLDLTKLTWAARFPKLDRHHEDNADLANAFASEHRALVESLDKVFHDGTEETDEEGPPESEETPPVEAGILAQLSNVERGIMGLLARMPHGATDVSVWTTTTQEETAACEKLVSLGYLVENNTHPTIGRNWSITPKGKAFNRGATPEPTDEEIERTTLEMINSGTMVSTYEGGPPAGGPRTEAALKKLVAAGAADTWRDGKHTCYGSKATRAKYEPPAVHTTISADPLLDAAEGAMLEALRKGPIVSNPAVPFSELTYEALVSLSRKGLARGTHSDLTGCTTWQVTKPAQAGEPMRVASAGHVHTSPFESNHNDPTDPRGMVHALVAEHGGFGKPVPTGSTTFNRDGLLIDGKPSPLNVAFKLVAALIELEAQAPTDLAGHGFADMLAFSPNPSGASREHVATCLAYAGLLHDLRTNLAIELAGLAETARGNAAKASHSVGYWTAELARMPVPKPADRPS